MRRALIVALAAATLPVCLVACGSSTDGSGQVASSSARRVTSAAVTAPATSTPASAPTRTAGCAKPPSGSGAVTFDGVTVRNPKDLKKDPRTSSRSTTTPTALECQDLVVGTGKAATATSQVKVQYAGVLYKNGLAFDSSWARGGEPAPFSLTGVVPGFAEGIGGTGAIAPMRVGGRRILILPAALGYGSQETSQIPANSALVFVVDLVALG